MNAPLGSAWGYSNKDLKRAQLDDPNIGPIYRWLKHHRAPSQDELEASSPETKAYYIGFELLRFHNDVLYMFRVKDHGDKLLLPHKLREEAMQLHHNIPTAGHPGMNRTLDRLKQKFTWYKMKADVQDFVASCQACNLNKGASRKSRFPLRERPSSAPMETLHIDYLGPISRSAKNNRFILVAVCAFTKWCELIPLPDSTAKTTAEALVSMFYHVGIPRSIISDKGTNFESQLMAEF